MFLMDKYDPVAASSVQARLERGEVVYVWVIRDRGIFKRGIYCLSSSPGIWVTECLSILTADDAIYMVRKKVVG